MEHTTNYHKRPEILNGINNRLFLVAGVFYSMLVIFSVNDFFFWDTVQLASKHADFYFKNDLKLSFLPNELDSGHIPFLGFLIAIVWSIFGKSLIVSHLIMLPFVWFQVYFLMKIINGIQLKNNALLFILCLLHPVLIAQNTLISPDVVLMAFFLMSIYAILNHKECLLIIGAIGLVAISNRGVMVLAGLGLFDFIMRFQVKDPFISRPNFRRLLCYFPAAGVFLLYSYLHFDDLGWIGYHEDSPWNESFRSGGIQMYFRNFLTLSWRFIDFGLWFPLVSGFICFILRRKQLLKEVNFKKYVTLFLCISFFLILPAMMFYSLSGHRYLMPATLILLLLSGMAMIRVRYGNVLIVVSMLSLLSGHLIIYPETLSQGWDSSLAYKPYIKLRGQMAGYMDQNGISFEETATFFPNKNTEDHLLLNGAQRIMGEFDQTKSKYVFYSNIYNVSDEVQHILYNNYTIEKQFQSGGIKVILFKIRE